MAKCNIKNYNDVLLGYYLRTNKVSPPPPPPPNKKGSKLLPSITFPFMWFSLKAPHGHSMGVTSILKPKKLLDVSN
jgi:hypothetical protein